jgi:hypothetical protein
MDSPLAQEVAALKWLTVGELRARYAEVFGEAARTRHKTWLLKRIAWRIQVLVEGDLSQRARQRAAELANDADLRRRPPLSSKSPASERTATMQKSLSDDKRLPPPGTILTRNYKGHALEVRVLSKGFEFEGEVYRTLSAVAKSITGSHCNGYHFFRLAKTEVNSL